MAEPLGAGTIDAMIPCPDDHCWVYACGTQGDRHSGTPSQASATMNVNAIGDGCPRVAFEDPEDPVVLLAIAGEHGPTQPQKAVA